MAIAVKRDRSLREDSCYSRLKDCTLESVGRIGRVSDRSSWWVAASRPDSRFAVVGRRTGRGRGRNLVFDCGVSLAENSGSASSCELATGWVWGCIIRAAVDRSWSNGADRVASVVVDSSTINDLAPDRDRVFSVVFSIGNGAAIDSLVYTVGLVVWAKCDVNCRISSGDHRLAKIGFYVFVITIVSGSNGVVRVCIRTVE